MTMVRITTLMTALALTGAPAWAAEEIPGFEIESISSSDTDLASSFSNSNRDNLSVNAEECDAYMGGSVTLSVGFDAFDTGDVAVYYDTTGNVCPSDMSNIPPTTLTGACYDALTKEALDGRTSIEFDIIFDQLLASCTEDGTAKILVYIETQDTIDTSTMYTSTIEVAIDLTAPEAPTINGVTGGDGLLTVSWDTVTDADTYTLYWDTVEFDDAMAQELTTYKTDIADTEADIDYGLSNGVTYFTAVAAVDSAGNVGPLSELSSGVPVETTDFWEHYKANGGTDPGEFCFIATAAYGTPMAAELTVLRTFRDEVLLTSTAGRWFVNTYYRWGRFAAAWIADKPTVRAVTRVALLPLTAFATVATELGFIPALLLMLGLVALMRTLSRRLADVLTRHIAERAS
jgi:hypothetical protein